MSSCKQILIVWVVLYSFSAYSLTLPQAEKIAFNSSNLAKQAQLNSQALEQLAQAAGEYNDPKLNFGLFNLPTDDFSTTQNPTTQLRVGFKQMLPRGSILEYKRAEKNNLAKVQQLKSADIILQVLKNTRLAYLDVFNMVNRRKILINSRKNFAKLVNLTEQKFANGLSTQQAVINAKLQLAQVADKILQTNNILEISRSKLSRWIADDAYGQISADFPSLKITVNIPQNWLENHPTILQSTAMISSMEDKLSISQELKKPAWTVGVEYRKRFGDNPDFSNRSDMLALTASLDLPIFADKKQNRVVAASQLQVQAAEQRRFAIKKQLTSDFRKFSQQKIVTEQRLKLYQNSILNKTHNNSKAALQAYQNGKSDFATLITAENLQLNTKIEILNLKVQILKTTAQLLYFINPQEQL